MHHISAYKLSILIDENGERLAQNRLTISIVQGSPVVILLWTVAAILLSRADSQLLTLIPGDIGHLMFVDHMFSLGWWEVNGKGTRRFGIDVGQSSFD
jgi:hypothetical protein